MAKEISIDEVLALLRQDHGQGGSTCTLRVKYSSGKNRGKTYVITQARYGAPRKEGAPREGLRPSTAPYMHNDAGTIPITDVANHSRYISPSISHIIGYNQYLVRH